MKNRVIYPTLVKQYDDVYLAYIPDLDVITEGRDEFDAISMARDAISLSVMSLQDDNQPVPSPSSAQAAIAHAEKRADEETDFTDGMLTYVDADIAAYSLKCRNHAVKKNCTIPAWMNEEATALGLNFSQILQEALAQKLGAK